MSKADLSSKEVTESVGRIERAILKHLKTQAFFEYTRRYDDMTKEFPTEWRTDGLEKTLEEHQAGRDKMRIACIRYLNLCSEEIFLARDGLLPEGIWTIWEPQIRGALRTPLFRSAWRTLRGRYADLQEFVNYVDEAQNETAVN